MADHQHGHRKATNQRIQTTNTDKSGYITTRHIYTIYIPNQTSNLPKTHKPRSLHNLETSMASLKTTLTLLANHEQYELAKDTSTHIQSRHASCHTHIDLENILTTTSSNCEIITNHLSLSVGAKKRQKATHAMQTYTT
jgi:hypothetical protein